MPPYRERAVIKQAQSALCANSFDTLDIRKLAGIPFLSVPIQSVPIQSVPIQSVPIQAPADVHSLPAKVLCLGPKRSGDKFTARDRALLTTLARHISILLHNHTLHAELDSRLHDLEQVIGERTALTDRLVTVSERERRELAAVLHDDAIQLAGQVERLLGDVVAAVEAGGAAGELANEAWRLSHEVTGRLRDVVSALHPPPLDMAGLVPALQTLLRDAGGRADVTCTFTYDPCLEDCRLPLEDEHLLYQLAREALANALRHAAPSMVSVELGLADSSGARLVVRDDGRGFESQPLSHWLAAGHLGLALLHERVQEAGGHVHIATAPGAGTTVTVELPPVEASGEEGEPSDDSYRSR